MVKPYFHKKQLYVPIYDTFLIVIFTNDINEIKKYDNNFFENEVYAQAWENGGKFFIALNFHHSDRLLSYGVANHEIFHASNFILESIGVQPSFENDEAQAYLINYLTDEVFKFARDKKMKFRYAN